MEKSPDWRRSLLRELFDCAVRAAMPDAALERVLKIEDGALFVAGESIGLSGAVHVIALGKGAAPMAACAERLLGERLAGGIAIVKDGHGLPLRRIRLLEAAHPVPDSRTSIACAELFRYLRRIAPGDLVLALITGGASALTTTPADGLTLEDLQRTTRALLACGASIHEMNAVRKHLGRVGGGRLVQAAEGASVRAILISDVIGDRADVIASGPFAPDASTFADALDVIGRYGIEGRVPATVIRHLEQGALGIIPETPKAGDAVFARVKNIVAASNATALSAIARRAAAHGLRVAVDDALMQGEARSAALSLLERAGREFSKRPSEPLCFVAGGETTVTLGDSAGLGGRCQEMALAAALQIQNDRRITALFAGTDGTDGPTDAAGGFADADCFGRLMQLGAGEARRLLEGHESYQALERCSALFRVGPTRTNVMDVAMVIIESTNQQAETDAYGRTGKENHAL